MLCISLLTTPHKYPHLSLLASTRKAMSIHSKHDNYHRHSAYNRKSYVPVYGSPLKQHTEPLAPPEDTSFRSYQQSSYLSQYDSDSTEVPPEIPERSNAFRDSDSMFLLSFLPTALDNETENVPQVHYNEYRRPSLESCEAWIQEASIEDVPQAAEEEEWDYIQAPASMYFPPSARTSLRSSTSTVFRPPTTRSLSYANPGYGPGHPMDGQGSSRSSKFESYRTSVDLSREYVVPAGKHDNVAKKQYEFGSFVLVRRSPYDPWIVGNYVAPGDQQPDTYEVEVIENFETNECALRTYTIDNIMDIPEDDTPHILTSDDEKVKKLMRYTRQPIPPNTFLFAAFITRKSFPKAGEPRGIEVWHPAMFVSHKPGYGSRVRVVGGELSNQLQTAFIVKPYDILKPL